MHSSRKSLRIHSGTTSMQTISRRLPAVDWFNVDAQNNVMNELTALNDRQDRIADLTERTAGLTIG